MNLIGNLSLNYRQAEIDAEMIHRLKSFKCEIADLNYSISALCFLPNNYLLAANCVTQNLILYDSEFNLVKTFFQFNSRSLFPLSLATNKKDRIYISDSYNHRIIMTDIDLNLLYEIGSNGCKVDEFNYPCGLTYYSDLVYVCDTQNQRLQVYNKNLVFKQSHVLNFSPFEIQCLNSFACIRDNDQKSIHFYDLKSFELKIKYDGHNGTIFVLNNFIYEYFNESSVIFIYNCDCEIIEIVELTPPVNDLKFNGFESICFFNGKFILATENSKKICLI